MRMIALFMPAVITLSIRYRRNEGREWGWFRFIQEYVTAVLFNVFATQSVITYLLGMGGVDIEAFDSFPFFTKYLFIACVFAFLFAYMVEIIKKYIHISFEVGHKE